MAARRDKEYLVPPARIDDEKRPSSPVFLYQEAVVRGENGGIQPPSSKFAWSTRMQVRPRKAIEDRS
ncbi:hypothetical protein TWF217_011932 [Orbilia oligospora]|nr:hypothetical protein TWF217_011932 [Orbilia oligospora]